MKKIFYGRISTKEQNEARQIQSAIELNIDLNNDFYLDKQTGNNFNRPKYQEMINKLKTYREISEEEITVYVHELDRFGRNYNEIKKQITEFDNLNIKLVFLDVPIIKTGDNATDRLLRDQFINTLAYVAEKETERRKKRQAEGIAEWKRTGKTKAGKKAYGRPKFEVPKDFVKYYEMTRKKTITNVEACKILDIKKATFYKYVKILKEQGIIKEK